MINIAKKCLMVDVETNTCDSRLETLHLAPYFAYQYVG